MLVNTREFSRDAQYFTKHGVYTKAIKNSNEYREYWREQARRSLYGYQIGDTWISGYHYFYLNFCQILRTEDTYGNVHDNKPKKAKKEEGFPAFWDLDYRWFHAVEKAEREGKHLIVLKARGKGFSYKSGAMGDRDFFLVKKSISYYLATEKAYLIDDGILTKCWNYMDFIDTHTAWRKRRMVNNDKMHKRASYKNTGEEIERGYKSEIIGVSMKDNPDKARGKRTGTAGKIYIEEAGNFADFLQVFESIRPSVEQGKFATSNIIAYGTGGTEGVGFEGLEEAFYNPEAYNCLAFTNEWDEDLLGEECGFFVPDWECLDGFIDENGNSDKAGAMAFEEKQRVKASKSSKPAALDRRKAEHPFVPQDALLNTSTNPFPKAELKVWQTELKVTGKLHQLCIPGELEETATGVKFKLNTELKPVLNWPIKPQEDNSGCVVIIQAPFAKVSPKGMYVICVDPYAHDTSGGDSVGAAYVLKNINNVSKPDDMIVAFYVGRPNKQDDFHKNIKLLAEYYNAEIGFENDRGEAFIAYFKNERRTYMLAEEFQLHFNSNIPKSSVRREYGMHIGSGKDNTRKNQGDKYIAEWLVEKRGMTEDGKIIKNLHKIYDIGLIEELIKYKPDKNFDRVSALRIGMYHMKEQAYNNVVVQQSRVRDDDDFFERDLY